MMGPLESDNPYEPPFTDITPAPQPARFWTPPAAWAIEATVGGVPIALFDIHTYGPIASIVVWAYVVTGIILGLRYGLWALLGWIPLGTSLYFVHLVAIAVGYEPPFVESSYENAEACLFCLFPAGFGVMTGVVIRLVYRVLPGPIRMIRR